MHTTPYTARIAALLNPIDNIDPRHVEAFMRVEHSTLDGLSARQFAAEVVLARDCIREGGRDMAERVAQSFGL